MRPRPGPQRVTTPWHGFRGGDVGAWMLHPQDAHAPDPVVIGSSAAAVTVMNRRFQSGAMGDSHPCPHIRMSDNHVHSARSP